jgi:hypothetical protein
VTKDEESRSGLHRTATQLAAMLASTAAMASLFYAGGLLNRVGYLTVFRAPWLSRDLSSADIFRGGVEILPPVLVVFVGIASLFRVKPSETKVRIMWWSATLLMLLDTALFAVEATSSHRFTLYGRATYHVVGAVAATFAAGLVTMFTIISAADKSAPSFRTAFFGVVVLALVFVVVPVLTGRSHALRDLAFPSRLPTARTADSQQLPIVAVTQERVYCLSRKQPVTLTVLKWDDVKAITAPATP